MKKVAMLATVAAALAALAIPAAASASNWQHNGGSLQQNAHIQITGQAAFLSGGLGTECQVDSTTVLLGNSTTAIVEQFEPDLTAQGSTVTQACFVQPGLESLGCTDAALVTPEGLPWEAHKTSAQTIEVTFEGLQNHLHGGIFCPKTTQITPGTVHLTAEQNPYHQGQLSGTLKTHNPALQVAISGKGTVTPANTYGG